MCMYFVSQRHCTLKLRAQPYEQTGGNRMATAQRTALINHWQVTRGPSHDLNNRNTDRLLDPAASDAQPHQLPVSPYRLPLTTIF